MALYVYRLCLMHMHLLAIFKIVEMLVAPPEINIIFLQKESNINSSLSVHMQITEITFVKVISGTLISSSIGAVVYNSCIEREVVLLLLAKLE